MGVVRNTRVLAKAGAVATVAAEAQSLRQTGCDLPLQHSMTECYAYSRIRRRTHEAAAAGGLQSSGRAQPSLADAGVASLTLHGSSGAPQLLPAWESLAGGSRGRQYAWDGRRLRLVDPQSFTLGGHDSGLPMSPDALGRALRRAQRRVWGAFMPDTESVTPDYWDYARWRFVQRVAAQALAVLATQQMLRAVGLGACPAVWESLTLLPLLK